MAMWCHKISLLQKITQKIISTRSKSYLIEYGTNSLKVGVGQIGNQATSTVLLRCKQASVISSLVVNQLPPYAGPNLQVDTKTRLTPTVKFARYGRSQSLLETKILTSRLIDRSIRSILSPDLDAMLQIQSKTLSSDPHFDSDVLSINAASLNLVFSSLKQERTIAAVRAAMSSDKKVIIFPSKDELYDSLANIVLVVDSAGDIVMIEGAMDRLDPAAVFDVLSTGWEQCALMAVKFESLHNQHVEDAKVVIPHVQREEVDLKSLQNYMNESFVEFFKRESSDKKSSVKALELVRVKFYEKIKDYNLVSDSKAKIFDSLLRSSFTDYMMNSDTRIDGRKFGDVREISCDYNVSHGIHGSAIFKRGETQVMAMVELLSPYSNERAFPLSAVTRARVDKQFELLYEFPSYSINEIRTTSVMKTRREFGHGALAERALLPTVPLIGDRFLSVACEVTDSNGSSSMASVCAGSLALINADVKVIEVAAGVAMGLIIKGKQWKVITDITGFEDNFGNMDFKLGGTKSGLTAIQVDMKGVGMTLEMLMDVLNRGHTAISFIIDKMNDSMKVSTKEKNSLPVSGVVEVTSSQRGRLVGPGGRRLRSLMNRSGAQIELIDDGSVFIFAPDEKSYEFARQLLCELMLENEVPQLKRYEIYDSQIVEVNDVGVWVRVTTGMEPLFVHRKNLTLDQVETTEELGLKEGDFIKVKYFGIDPLTGKHRLNRISNLFSFAYGIINTEHKN